VFISLYAIVWYHVTREYVSRIAKTVKEACQPIEEGFEYLCDFDGIKLFKKEETTLEL